jgi:hypothetical protein
MNRDDEQQQPRANNQPQSPLDDASSTPYSPSEIEPSTVEQSGQDMPDPLDVPQKASSVPLSDPLSAPAASTTPPAQPPVQPRINPMDDAANGFAPIAGAQKPKRAKWLIPVIIAGALVLLGGGSVLAYKFWYQNPNKVISDGLLHAVEAKSLTYTASIKMTSGGVTPYNVSISGISNEGANSVNVSMTIAMGSQAVTIKAGGIIAANGDLYINVSNLSELAKTYEAQLPASSKSLIDDFVKKVDGEWIKIGKDKLKDFSESYAKTQQCLQSGFDKVRSDKSYGTELVDLYKAHPFFKVAKELGSKNGSLGYQIADNPTEGKAFGEGLKNTKLYKLLHDCDNSITIDTSDTTDTSQKSNSTVEIWVSQWSHEITKFTANSSDNGQNTEVVFEPSFNAGKKVTIPQNTKSIDQFMQDIQDLQTSLMPQSTEMQPEMTPADASLLL